MPVEAGRIAYNTRETITELFNAPDPMRVIFTLNATHAINLVLRGLLHPGDRVVTTSMEHNAVMRPLRTLEQQGVQWVVVPRKQRALCYFTRLGQCYASLGMAVETALHHDPVECLFPRLAKK